MIVVIGGSGFYDFLEETIQVEIDTAFGTVTIEEGTIQGRSVGFLARHGRSHSLTPSNINYRANILAIHQLDADMILTTNAVGSLNSEVGPGSLIVPDQILDLTSGRPSTFFDGGNFSTITRSGKKLSGVVHTDVTHPFDPSVRTEILDAARHLNQDMIDSGTMVVTNGPRYETPAEIRAAKVLGGDIAGMTSAPEAFLAKELEIPYATVAVVTNFAAGMQSSITHEEVGQIFQENIDLIKSLFERIITTRD